MTGRRRDYGSEYHLRRYLETRRARLDRSILEALGEATGSISWLLKKGEYQGMGFLERDHPARRSWRTWWPQSGTQPSWDAVGSFPAAVGNEWLLVEAKANHPEFCSKPSRAEGPGRKTIQRALGQTKNYLGVHRDFDWLGTYYQYANRLACLYFLRVKQKVPARLVFLHFLGDRFPDGRFCPTEPREWRAFIEACHLTLGLPKGHALEESVLDVFLPIAE